MIVEVDPVDDFLEHFGVKGMKWGKRKSKKKRTLSEQMDRNEKIMKVTSGVTLGLGVATGALFASNLVKKQGYLTG